jgi:hypothetical protein
MMNMITVPNFEVIISLILPVHKKAFKGKQALYFFPELTVFVH